jgi:hypothetical protein
MLSRSVRKARDLSSPKRTARNFKRLMEETTENKVRLTEETSAAELLIEGL